jgi:carbamoyltransferase
MTLIIGYNLSHDSSVCLVGNGEVMAASALERIVRLKRGVVPAHAYAAAMATLTREVLASERLRPSDVDYWIATSTESRDQADEDRLADSLGLLIPDDRRLALPHPGHHLAHASAAFYTSGFHEAAALVVDAYGSLINGGRERETGFLFREGEPPQRILEATRGDARIAGRLRADGSLGLPDALSGVGEIYRAVTLALGFFESGTYDDAGKTMGLAPYGRRLSEHNLFIEVGPSGLSFDRAADSFVELGMADRDGDGLRLLPRRPGAPIEDTHRALAAQVQAEFEDACLHLVRTLLETTGMRSLVLGGGCFLNSVFNAKLMREVPELDRVWVFPAATDDGNAVGAALYAHHVLTPRNAPAGPAPRLRHVYLGPSRLAELDVLDLAREWGLTAVKHDSPRDAARQAADAIARGEIIGWFQDRGELGPRALGARSILCHPGLPGMKDRLNSRVKFRESFRPFAGAVLAEQAGKWFDMLDPNSPFMLHVWPVAEALQEQIGEVVHVDGTCRVQTVDADLPGTFRALLEEFEATTGLPIVLNTSFNLRGMPIVERPEEAFDCLYGSRLDRMFIGDVEVSGVEHTLLQPVVEQRQSPVGTPARLLDHADGQRTVAAIADILGVDAGDLVEVALDLRRLRMLWWAGVPRLPASAYPLPQYEPVLAPGLRAGGSAQSEERL